MHLLICGALTGGADGLSGRPHGWDAQTYKNYHDPATNKGRGGFVTHQRNEAAAKQSLEFVSGFLRPNSPASEAVPLGLRRRLWRHRRHSIARTRLVAFFIARLQLAAGRSTLCVDAAGDLFADRAL